MLRRYILNASANVGSGAITAAYQLSITALAVTAWHGATLTTWALAISVAAIMPVLSANLSSVIARRVVEARQLGPGSSEVEIVSSGHLISRRLALSAVVLLWILGTCTYWLSVSAWESTGTFVILLVILLVTNIWTIIWQVPFGQHFADERNWLATSTVAFARGGGTIGMFVALTYANSDLIVVAIGLCAGTWIGIGAAKALLPKPHKQNQLVLTPRSLENREQTCRTMRILAGFAVGTLSTLVVQYSIPLIVAILAPDRFNAFYVANTLNMVTVGVLAAAMLALLAPFTRLNARSDARIVEHVALFSPTLCAATCLLILSLGWFSLDLLAEKITSRSVDTNDIRLFLALLGFQTIVRTATAGFATFVSAAGTSKQMSVPLIIEMTLAFVVAVPAGYLFGIQAFLAGLTISSLVGSLYSGKILVSLYRGKSVSARTATLSLFLAQLIFSALWWQVVRAGI